jgi:hypothetical protein
MRAVIFAAALLIGTAAYAQDTTAPSGGQTVEPSNAAPRHDARGVPVISAPATSPAGWNQPPGTPSTAPASQPAAAQGNEGPMPPCTRKVTDHCTQTYERNHGPAGDAMAAAPSGDTAAAADTDAGTKKATHHRRRHHRR